jgi:hypothetical protein
MLKSTITTASHPALLDLAALGAALATGFIDWLQRRYLRKIERYLDHVDGFYRAEYAEHTLNPSRARRASR